MFPTPWCSNWVPEAEWARRKWFLAGPHRSQRDKKMSGRGKNIFLTDAGRSQGKFNGAMNAEAARSLAA